MSEIQHAVVTQMEEGRKERVNRLYSMIKPCKTAKSGFILIIFMPEKKKESHTSVRHTCRAIPSLKPRNRRNSESNYYLFDYSI